MPTRQGSADGESDHGDQRTPDRTRPEPEHPAGTERTSSPGGPQESSTRDGSPANGSPANGGPANGTSTGGSPENSSPENSSPENSTPEARTPEDGVPGDRVPGDGAPGDRAPANGNGESGEDGTWAQGQARRTTRTDSAKLAGRASAEAAVAAGEATTSASARAPDLTAAAFFDVDNTMMMGASLFHFARGLAARKFFTASDLAGFAWQQLKFRVGGREDPHDVQSSSEQALSFVAGRKVRELVDLSEEIYDELMADRIWAGTRALAEHHLERGQRVWLVTATPVELAQIIARRLGLTGALGTVAESARGVYTGRLVGEMLHGRAKAHAVRALAASEGLDLRRCTAYSDSANDVPMLSAVGTAVAVNPDQRLRDVARARGWEVRDFRTGRKAARIGVHSALGAGAVAGAVAAGLAYRRREHF